MQFTTVAASLLAVAPVMASPTPPPVDLVELNLPEPRDYVATPVWAGQQIDTTDYRADVSQYTEETWVEHAKQRCRNNAACHTVNAFLIQPSGILNDTDPNASYWIYELYAGPVSTAENWKHFGYPIDKQHIFTARE